MPMVFMIFSCPACGASTMPERVSIAVVGSVNLDLTAAVDRLPVPGETVTGATLSRFPGGKGANQALAAKRLGADVALIACVGDDAEAEAALRLLVEGGVDLSGCMRHATAATGVALIAVAPSGENQIVVAPGANRELVAGAVRLPPVDALICQLEVPLETLEHVAASFDGFVCLNLAPAIEVQERLVACADLIVVNETEAQFYGALLDGARCLVARTLGSSGAKLFDAGRLVASANAFPVQTVDTTGAGDAFTAALTVSLLEGRDVQAALEFACAAGAAAATRAGAQPSLPSRGEVEKMLAGQLPRNAPQKERKDNGNNCSGV